MNNLWSKEVLFREFRSGEVQSCDKCGELIGKNVLMYQVLFNFLCKNCGIKKMESLKETLDWMLEEKKIVKKKI